MRSHKLTNYPAFLLNLFFQTSTEIIQKENLGISLQSAMQENFRTTTLS